ncbi:hypothetical protein BU23DRAFT_630786 [Bimuria novae-zelandiae CBS 107.79]|uniref:Uncharacterized protein n=1 Tax=Bimuria novae-zelandiae CBS 107.79 TaxID=1447943 RepID=A0A6A5UIZ5_9PLEO|nr:hypothetical protein BU23DRAFT_630786 [Bimuria novae-zelandiae CBS 107.79]
MSNSRPLTNLATETSVSLLTTETASQNRRGQTSGTASRKPAPSFAAGSASSTKRVPVDRRPPPLPVRGLGLKSSGQRPAQAGPASSAGAKKTVSRPSMPSKQQPSRPTSAMPSRKPLHPQSEAEKWKAKYEQQVQETVKAEARLQECESEAAEYAGQLSEARAELDMKRTELKEAELSRVQLSIELNHQTRLAGELQMELNVANHVHIPRIQQSNEALHNELLKLRDDFELSENLLELEALCEENEALRAANVLNVAAESLNSEAQTVIETLEKTNEELSSMYPEAMTELEDSNYEIEALNGEIELLEGQHEALKTRIMQLTTDLDEVRAEKEGLEMEAQARVHSSISIPHVTSTVSVFSGVVGTVQTEPVSPCQLSSRFSGIIASLQVDSGAPSSTLSLSQVSAISANFSQPESILSAPQPPLDQILKITINVDPSAPASLSLLKHLSAITSKKSSLKINGPAEIARALARGMSEVQAEAERDKAKVLELQQMLWNKISEVNRLKQEGCSVKAHRSLSDELAAMQARFEMQELFLADYGRQLARLKGPK